MGAPSPVVTVHEQAGHGAAAVALELADLIESRPAAVLGLATGGTMVEVYAALVAEVRGRDLPVGEITTFNLDEYVGLPADGSDYPRHSFARFMHEHLFSPLGLAPSSTWFPDAELARRDPVGASRAFEQRIEDAGGIDVQLLGLGRNGHIAFNEPGSEPGSRTRVVQLDGVTRRDAAEAFQGLEHTPSQAITMGIATILEAKALRVLAFGESKAGAVMRMLEGDETTDCPCTYLRRRHKDLAVHLDGRAASRLGQAL